MKTNYITKIYSTDFSPGVNPERKQKFIATIILSVCLMLLIVTRSFSQCTYNAYNTVPSCVNYCTGDVVFTASGGTPPYFLNISGGPQVSFNSSYTWTTACYGPAYYSITDALGNCQYSGSVFVNLSPIYNAGILVSSPSGLPIYCPNTLMQLYTSIGSGYLSQWRLNGINIPGAINNFYTPSGTGVYDCVFTDASGCTSVSINSVTVTNAPGYPALITANGPLSCVSSVTLNANTGSGLSYQWRLNGTNITGATMSSYTAALTGNYDCIVSSATCYSASNVLLVTIALPSASITAAGPTTFCYGNNVTLNASPTGPGYTYQWRNNNVNVIGATSSSYIAALPGNYDVVMNNGCSTSNSILVSVPNIVTNTLYLQPNATNGTDAMISSYPNYLNLNFGTYPDLPAKAGTSQAVNFVTRGLVKFDLSSIPTNATVYQARLQLFNNPTSTFGPHGGTNAGWLQKITSPWAENTVTWNNQPTTATANQVTIPQSTSGNQDYNLDVTTLVQDMVSNPATNYGFLIRLQGEITYRALIFASSDCSDPTKWPAISVNYFTFSGIAAAVSPVGPIAICSPGNVVLNATPIGAGYSYQWNLNGIPVTGATLSSYSATLAGSYDCTVSNICGNSTSNSVTVTVNSAPAASITPAGPTTFCAPGSVTLNANTGSGLSYQWRLNGVNIPGQVLSAYVATAGGNYDCIVSNVCGSTTSNIISVVADILPSAIATAGGPLTFCFPGSVALNVSACTSCTCQWRQNLVNIPAAIASSYVASSSGNYDCLVTNSCGARTSNVITVAVEVFPSASITAAGPTTFCAPSSVTLNANTGAGLSYQWRLNGSNISGATFASLIAAATGNYDCIVSNTCGNNTSNIISVIVSPLPPANITASGSTTVCSPNSVTLNANTGAGLSYQWRLNGGNISGATLSSFNAFATGGYDCIVTNSCGSTLSNPIAVTVSVMPATPGTITGQTSGTCSATLTYTITPVPSATGYTWTVPGGASISSGQGTASVNVTYTNSFSSGNISVVATNICGSSGASSLAVSGVPAQPGTITGPVSVCHNQNNVDYTIAAVTGATSYTWTVPSGTQIKNGQGTTHIRVRFGNSAGNITVRASNSCGQGPIRTLAIAMPCRDDIAEGDLDASLYPNPATNQLSVINHQLSIERVEIFDAMGQSILIRKPATSSQQLIIDISALPNGIYFTEIISGEQKKVLKFIKQQ